MHPEVGGAEAFIQVYHHRLEAIQPDALVAGRTEYQRLALFEEYGFFRLGTFFREYFKSAVVENIAVLVDLKEGCAMVAMRPQQHGLQVFYITIHRTGNKGRICTQGQRQRVKRMVDASVRG